MIGGWQPDTTQSLLIADHALIVSKHLGYWQLKIPNVIDASTDERL